MGLRLPLCFCWSEMGEDKVNFLPALRAAVIYLSGNESLSFKTGDGGGGDSLKTHGKL